ncbi:MAG: phosphatase PAP2 family protein [Paludibacter sp.]
MEINNAEGKYRKANMEHFKKYYAFYVPYILFVITLTVLILSNEKADLHLWLTSFNTPGTDDFFRIYTNVGGSLPYFIAGFLLFYRFRLAVFLLITQIASSLFSVFVKQTWNEPRAIKYFADNYPNIKLHEVAGVHLYSFHSFPSGHTITAFAFFMALSFFTTRSYLHFLYFILAVLVGFSRIYLSQHFALDVLVGSLIGVAVTVSWQNYFETLPLKWAEGSLRDVFSRKKR